MAEQDRRDRYREMMILLVVGSALLGMSSVYFVQIFSVQYGIAAGAIVQSGQTNTTIIPAFRLVGSQIQGLYRSILESWLGVVLGAMLLLISFMLYLGRANRFDEQNRKYMLLHTTLTFIYIILFAIIYSGFIHTTLSILLYFGFFGIIVCVITDLYLEYEARSSSKRAGVRAININPETPYTNMQVLKNQLFSKLKGNIRIVDKHFNTEAIANLHRLIAGEMEGIDSISVITSEDMLDSEFRDDYKDIMKELKNNGIEMEVKVMTSEDASAQHERFVLDDQDAFKIPPLNIINKKSEHITKINVREARRRFDYLHQRALKYENYLLRQDRPDSKN